MSTTKVPAAAGSTTLPASAGSTKPPASAGGTAEASAGGTTVPAPADGESSHRARAPWDDAAEIGPAAWTAEPHGRHRMPQSSVRPAATALVSGLLTFLTGRRPDVGTARHAPVHSANRHRQISA